MSGGRWRAVELRDEQSSSPRSWEPNFELPADTCIGAAELRSYVKENDGFEYVDEGTALHPKPGLVARSAGATLALCLPIHCDRDGCAEKHQLAALGYLKSYDERMGNALVTCEEGCSCGGAGCHLDVRVTFRCAGTCDGESWYMPLASMRVRPPLWGS